METRQAYAELGLEPGASEAQIKASWRRLVAAWHPDRNAAADAGRRMQRINKAYQHIRQLREDGDDGAAAGADAGREAEQAAAAAAPEPPASEKMHLRQVRLTLEEAILGCTRTLSGHYSHCCDVCAGKGQRVLAKACGDCRGSGAVRRPALFGWLWNEEACAGCGGDGRQRAPCDACVGRGEQVQAYRRRVRFPPGLRGGHVLTVPAAQPGEWGLELELEIEPHALFSLDDEGVLHCEMPVNGYAWMAGRWVDVPTPTGLQQMRLNREALVYRMRGQGFPETLRGPRGDYLVKVVPEFPAKADAAQEALLDELIASTSQAAEADAGQPLGQWQRRLKRWSGSRKEQPH